MAEASPAAANSSMATSAAPSAQKKKRTQPGAEPGAEVIALSPKALMATNRFICEVCKKGFQREQNLQLHKRGHNLPWKLKPKSITAVRKKVYVCPDPTCVHHNPSRALGDLTGIKKHFSRKHGEKCFKCEKCSKRYAVLSDWKAHSKICGTKEYTCDCGTLFSRRDSFMTHRAFCNAIAQENAVNPRNLSAIASQLFANQVSPHHHQELSFQDHTGDDFQYVSALLPSLSGSAFCPTSNIVLGSQNYHEEDQNKLVFNGMMMQQLPQAQVPGQHTDLFSNTLRKDDCDSPADNNSSHLSTSNLYADQLRSNEVEGVLNIADSGVKNIGGQISQSLYSSVVSLQNSNASALAHLSATALLQKAAQVGSACSIRSLGSSLFSSKHDLQAATSFGTLLGDQNSKHLHEIISSLGGVRSTRSDEYAANGEAKLNFVKMQEDEEGSKEMSVDGCDKLTRDFLGVGLIVRQMSNGFRENDRLQYQQGH